MKETLELIDAKMKSGKVGEKAGSQIVVFHKTIAN
jgi:hypothetical protein